MSRTDREVVDDALVHLDALAAHLRRADLSDLTVADAVSLRLAAAIDALAQGSDALRELLAGTEWRPMWAMRNRIVHGYSQIDRTMIRDTVERDIPHLERRLREFTETPRPGT